MERENPVPDPDAAREKNMAQLREGTNGGANGYRARVLNRSADSLIPVILLEGTPSD